MQKAAKLGDHHQARPRVGEIGQRGSAGQLEFIPILRHEAFQCRHTIGIDNGGAAVDIDHKAIEGAQLGAEGDFRRNTGGEIHVIEGAQHQPGTAGERVVAGLPDGYVPWQAEGVRRVVAQGQGGGGRRLGLAPLPGVGIGGIPKIGLVGVVIGDGRAVGGGRSSPPIEFIILRLRGEIPAVAQAHLLVEGIGGQADLDVAIVEFRNHLDDLHHRWVSGGGQSRVLTIAKHQGGIACSLAGGGERVAVAGRIGIRHLGECGRAVGFGEGAIHAVSAFLALVLHVGFDLGSQPVDCGVPFGLVCVPNGQKRLEGGDIGGRKHVQIEVILAGDLVVELAFQDQAALGAGQGIKKEPGLEVRRQPLEIGLPLVNRGFKRLREGGQ